MDSGGPYLNAAIICERVLQETDGIFSLIRAVDRFTISTVGQDAPSTIPPGIISFQLVVVLRSGIFKGVLPIRIVLNSPSSQVLGESSTDVFLEGDDRGANLVSPFQLVVQEDGLYWIDVYCGGQLFTRVPFRVIYQRIVQGSLKLQGPPPP
jgi:hypothetical protein